jgi:(E)-4-hydroxy-3-methylbut-2-enyl-diphosphate synthase
MPKPSTKGKCQVIVTFDRKPTRVVKIGGVKIGGQNPVAVQSMCDTDTRDVTATVKQIHALEEAGCEIVRVAVPDQQAAAALPEIKKAIALPLVADIHFDWKLAVASAKAGVDKLRINPGNIGGKEKIKEVVAAAKDCGLPIRVGVNQGSIEKDLLDKYGGPNPQALVDSALRNVEYIAEFDFNDIVLSLKASDASQTIAAYRLVSQKCDFPLHLGVTEAGPQWSGTIKTAVAFGALLAEGIGDTIRVSLTAPVEEEVKAGWEILKALGLRQRGPVLISCPTCGRLEIDLIALVGEVQQMLEKIKEPITVAVMGCVVNGPGEVRDADIGIIGGKGVYLLTRKGKIVFRTKELSEARSALLEHLDEITKKE